MHPAGQKARRRVMPRPFGSRVPGSSGTMESPPDWSVGRHNEFTAILERDGDWYIAYCPEIPGANGQGRTKAEARASLAEAIALILQARREDSLRGAPADAERDTVIVE